MNVDCQKSDKVNLKFSPHVTDSTLMNKLHSLEVSRCHFPQFSQVDFVFIESKFQYFFLSKVIQVILRDGFAQF